MLFLTFYKKILELKLINVAMKRNATQLTPVEHNGQACREPFGLETCRRAHVESLRAERPPGRTTRGTDKTLHFVFPQMLTELA
jgi:hypothetical protein